MSDILLKHLKLNVFEIILIFIIDHIGKLYSYIVLSLIKNSRILFYFLLLDKLPIAICLIDWNKLPMYQMIYKLFIRKCLWTK